MSEVTSELTFNPVHKIISPYTFSNKIKSKILNAFYLWSNVKSVSLNVRFHQAQLKSISGYVTKLTYLIFRCYFKEYIHWIVSEKCNVLSVECLPLTIISFLRISYNTRIQKLARFVITSVKATDTLLDTHKKVLLSR